jgi:uncharacterized protein YoxC
MNITSLDLLYIVLSLGFISLVIFINIILYNLLLTVRSFRKSIEKIDKVITYPINATNNVKLELLKKARSLVQKFSGRSK